MALDRALRGLVALELVAAGLALSYLGIAAPRYVEPPVPHASLAGARSGPDPVISGVISPVIALPRSAPVSVSIPALGVSSRLGPARGLNPDGTIDDAPLSGSTWSLPWWYEDGPSPGEAGSAVLLGHVDSAAGAGHLGVFFRLGELKSGDRIMVSLENGLPTQWTVASTSVYSDAGFPDSLVYARTGEPTLRLVTCGGVFDWRTHRYQSTVVVTAVRLL